MMAYYGMFRIGEIADSDHTILAKNVHAACNKRKMLFVLYSSKMHDQSCKPQKVKIAALNTKELVNHTMGHPVRTNKYQHDKLFCPFELLQNYIHLRGDFKQDSEQFFVLSDHSPLEQSLVRQVLSMALKRIGLNTKLYVFHGFHAGRATDLHKWGVPLEVIKSLGRWKSNTIY